VRNVDQFDGGVPGPDCSRRTPCICPKPLAELKQCDPIQRQPLNVAIRDSEPLNKIGGNDGDALPTLVRPSSPIPGPVNKHVDQMPLCCRRAIASALGNRDRDLGQEFLRRNWATPTTGPHQPDGRSDDDAIRELPAFIHRQQRLDHRV